MKYRLVLFVLLATSFGYGQQKAPSERRVDCLVLHGAPRLGALAKLGALTHTSLLLEVGDMHFMQAPVDVDVVHTTFRGAVRKILGTGQKYTLRNDGSLLILSASKRTDRMLHQHLGLFQFQGGQYSSFEPQLSGAIREATGCKRMGTAWAGPELAVTLPKIHLRHATFERVVAEVAKAPEATMWIVQTAARPAGCIEDPDSSWQTGVYGFGAGFSTSHMPFKGSAGSQFLTFDPNHHSYPDDCKSTRP